MENGLTAQHSKSLHGIAIMMMLFHHLFYPGRLTFEYYSLIDHFLGFGTEENIAAFLKICVAIFTFTGGYAMNRKSARSEESTGCELSVRTFVSFMRKYLIVFAVFIPLACIFADYGKRFTPRTFVYSLLGWDASFNDSWWYVGFYIHMLISFPLMQTVQKMVKKSTNGWRISHLLSAAAASFTFFYIMMRLNTEKSYTMIFLEGYLCAEFHVFEHLPLRKGKNGKGICNAAQEALKALLLLVLLAVVLWSRVVIEKHRGYGLADCIVIIPLIGLLVQILEKGKTVNRFFLWLGKYSTYMWLTHIFFAYSVFPACIMAVRIDVVMYCLLFAVSLLTAMLLTEIEKWLMKLYRGASGNILIRNLKKY